MNDEHPIAELIPWYANGTLADAARRELESHLPTCASCRELLMQARLNAELATEGPIEAQRDHVQPQLLSQYVEYRETLEPETIAWIEARLAECASCREAVDLLREVDLHLEGQLGSFGEEEQGRVPTFVERIRSGAESAWAAMSATVLRPAPALAYLILLLVAVPLVRFGGGVLMSSNDRGPAAVPMVVAVAGERAAREGEASATRGEVLELSSGAPVALQLQTDLTVDDLSAAEAVFDVELSREGRVLWSQRRAGSDFVSTGGRGELLVVVDPARLDPGAVHEIAVRAVKPGSPLDRQALFRRRLVVSPD